MKLNRRKLRMLIESVIEDYGTDYVDSSDLDLDRFLDDLLTDDYLFESRIITESKEEIKAQAKQIISTPEGQAKVAEFNEMVADLSKETGKPTFDDYKIAIQRAIDRGMFQELALGVLGTGISTFWGAMIGSDLTGKLAATGTMFGLKAGAFIGAGIVALILAKAAREIHKDASRSAKIRSPEWMATTAQAELDDLASGRSSRYYDSWKSDPEEYYRKRLKLAQDAIDYRDRDK